MVYTILNVCYSRYLSLIETIETYNIANESFIMKNNSQNRIL